MKHITYLKQLGYTLVFFGVVVFSGCGILKKIQEAYWPNENKQAKSSQEDMLTNSVSVMEKSDTVSDTSGEILDKSNEQENNEQKEQDDLYKYKEEDGTYKEEVHTQRATYTETSLTALCNSNNFDIESKNIIASCIIANPNLIDSMERHGVLVEDALARIDGEIKRAQAEAQRQERQQIWLYSLIRGYGANSSEEAHTQETERYALREATEVEPNETLERGEEAPDPGKQWGLQGCPICCDTDTENAIVVDCQLLIKDGHIFHKDCIEKANEAQYEMQEKEGLQRKATCPLCRGEIKKIYSLSLH